jgi:hypothetical protein
MSEILQIPSLATKPQNPKFTDYMEGILTLKTEPSFTDWNQCAGDSLEELPSLGRPL